MFLADIIAPLPHTRNHHYYRKWRVSMQICIKYLLNNSFATVCPMRYDILFCIIGLKQFSFQWFGQLALRQIHNKIHKDVNRLRAQSDKLLQENNNLKRETAKVQCMEASLSGIVGKQGSSVDTFVNLVKEHKSIQNKINVCPTLYYNNHLTVIIS
jgi:hypothetical protein